MPTVPPSGAARWDLTALFNAADPRAEPVERHLWVIRLFEWLRRAPLKGVADADAGAGAVAAADAAPREARPLLRLRHLLGVLERNPAEQHRVGRMLRLFMREVDSAALLADFGFAPRTGLWSEFARRLRSHVLPLTPATTDLGDLFILLFPDRRDLAWLHAIDDDTLARIVALLEAGAAQDEAERADGKPPRRDWRIPFLDAITFLGSNVRAAGFSPGLRRRMSPELLAESPFHQLSRAAERIGELGLSADPADREKLLQEAVYLRALLHKCRVAADSVDDHLEAHGVSVDVVFDADQLRARTQRIESLLTCVLAAQPAREIATLVAELIEASEDRRSIRSLFGQHYSLLAKKVAERSAATGEHYITRNGAEYRNMLRAALGGGAVLAATTLAKFGVMTLGLAAFWAGLAAGVNYALSFVVIQALHFTVATKQPAMTAPALAHRLADVSSAPAVERFVDEVAALIRSQVAGIFGNVLAVVPLVIMAQWVARATLGAPLVGGGEAKHVLESLTLLGPTALYAAFTGTLLFTSSLLAGWFENWFVWHRLDSAIAWNPSIVDRLGSARARRWSGYLRRNISGLASNISLGLLLGLTPAVAFFFSVPLDVRHVTLASGQLAAAVGALGLDIVREPAFWWCVAGIAATGVLNLGVSFGLAFRVALRSRDIRVADRSRIYRAIRSRFLRAPLSFVLPVDVGRRVRAAAGPETPS